MRLFSTAALSLALAAAAGFALPGAALAQKKEDAKAAEAAGPKVQASAAFAKVAKPVQDLINAKDFNGAVALIPDLETKATTADDRYFVGNFYLNVGLGLKDLNNQLKGITMMLDSGKVGAADLAKFQIAAGSMAMSLKNLEVARTHLIAAVAAGADVGDTEALIAETYFGPAYEQIEGNAFNATGRALAIAGLPHLRKAIDAQVAKGTPPPLGWYERGFQTAVVALAPDAWEWSKLTLAQTDKSETWRIALRSLQESHSNMPRGANIDLMRLMLDANALRNDYSYNEFVDALWKSGQPGEVKSVIDFGTKAGEIKQDRFAEFYKLASDEIPKDKAGLAGSATSAAAAPTGRPASRTADAYLGYGENAKAVELYKVALQKGGVDADEVNTRLGIALMRTGDFAGARSAFAAVSATNPRKQIAELWTLWLNKKAGATG